MYSCVNLLKKTLDCGVSLSALHRLTGIPVTVIETGPGAYHASQRQDSKSENRAKTRRESLHTRHAMACLADGIENAPMAGVDLFRGHLSAMAQRFQFPIPVMAQFIGVGTTTLKTFIRGEMPVAVADKYKIAVRGLFPEWIFTKNTYIVF